MLWIALHFPQLPLEVFLRGTPTPEPFAIADGHELLACDRKAALRGIRPGMGATTALALVPRLIVKPRDAAAETETLLGLAAWATAYTPSVALEFPDGLLLEISGSLKLLGGLETVLERLQAELDAMGFAPAIACAPTARAAGWLAQDRANAHAYTASKGRIAIHAAAHAHADAAQLQHAIAALPIAVLKREAEEHAALQAIGTATIGDILALPRDGVGRRFGQGLLDDIDRALGRLPEARSFFQVPAAFLATIELPSEVTQSEALLFAARRLLLQLAGFLAARSGGVQRITVRLAHRSATTEITIGMLAPSRDITHFTLLLRERMASLMLRDPVRAITISADDVVPLAGDNIALFAEDPAGTVQEAGQSWQRLIERLRMRLGNASVQGLAVAADHRPEEASLSIEPVASGRSGTPSGTRQLQFHFGERPFWLLAEPRPIREIGSTPHDEDEQPLELLAGPERIESGWWNGREAMRDYFVARSRNRALLWIYRERRPADNGGWYVHGIFS